MTSITQKHVCLSSIIINSHQKQTSKSCIETWIVWSSSGLGCSFKANIFKPKNYKKANGLLPPTPPPPKKKKKKIEKSTHKRFFCVLTYGCSISSSFSSGILHDLMLGLGLSLQYHFSGSLSGTVPSGNLRHLRQSGLSHCTHIWSGSSLKMKIQWNLPKCPLNRGCLLKLPYITNFNL